MALKIKEDEKEFFNCRTVLWYLVFTGFAVNYMIRINLNIGIVSMVKPRPKNNDSLTSECIAQHEADKEEEGNTTSVILLAQLLQSENNLSNYTENITVTTTRLEESTEETFEGFDWNEYQQGLILGAFFWLHWSTQIPGGILANKYGTKLVFGLSNFSGVLFCFVIPAASFMGYETLIIVRSVQGIVAGFSWPAMHTLTARWIPPNERSKFVTAYLGSSVGAALTFFMCGYIIDSWGWELSFYACGVLGTLWFIAWCFFVYDSPSEHPRITESEKEYILTSLGQSVSKKKAPVPWKDLLMSVPVWMNVLAQWGGIWGLFTIMTHAPTYFKMIHGWNIRATGFLSGMPHLLRMLFAYIFSLFGDYLLSTDKMSRTNVRKLATFVCCVGQGFCLLALAYSDCNYSMAIIFLTAATAVHGAVSTGPLASIVDISPNYASVTFGLINTIVAWTGFFAPLVTGVLTFENQTVAQWQKVFWIASVMLFVSGGLYMFFSKSDLEAWNSPNGPSNKTADALLESEMATLKKKPDEEEEEEEEDDDENYNNEKKREAENEKSGTQLITMNEKEKE